MTDSPTTLRGAPALVRRLALACLIVGLGGGCQSPEASVREKLDSAIAGGPAAGPRLAAVLESDEARLLSPADRARGLLYLCRYALDMAHRQDADRHCPRAFAAADHLPPLVDPGWYFGTLHKAARQALDDDLPKDALTMLGWGETIEGQLKADNVRIPSGDAARRMLLVAEAYRRAGDVATAWKALGTAQRYADEAKMEDPKVELDVIDRIIDLAHQTSNREREARMAEMAIESSRRVYPEDPGAAMRYYRIRAATEAAAGAYEEAARWLSPATMLCGVHPDHSPLGRFASGYARECELVWELDIAIATASGRTQRAEAASLAAGNWKRKQSGEASPANSADAPAASP